MARIDVELAGGRNVLSFLDAIAVSELGKVMLAMPETDDGYKVCVGSTPGKLILMDNYDDHPRKRYRSADGNINSDAAGRYQIMGKWWPAYKSLMRLPDFGPESQDRVAIRLIKECSAFHLVQDGQIEAAIRACNSRWASFPGAGYPHQRENSMLALRDAFLKAGGTVAKA